MIGAGRDTKEDAIDPAVGVILEVKVGQKVDAGGVLCRLYYTREEHVEEAAQLVEDAFRISRHGSGRARTDSRSRGADASSAPPWSVFTGPAGILVVFCWSAALTFLHQPRARFSRACLFWGLGLQFGFAFLVLKTPSATCFKAASNGVNHMLGLRVGRQQVSCSAISWACQTISSAWFSRFRFCRSSSSSRRLFAILYYLGVMQIFVRGMAVVMQRVMGTSGAESTNVAASIFMGQTEAPLTIRPFLAGLTQSRIVYHHGQRHGARLRSGDGGVRPDRACGDPASADRRDHDRAGDADAGEDSDAGDGQARQPRAASRSKWRSRASTSSMRQRAGRGDGLHLALNIGAMLIAFHRR